MIFKDRLDEKRKLIRPEIDRLIDIAWEKQAHKGDLLLFHVNGFYQEDMLIWNESHPESKLNPHVIGPGAEGHSEQSHYSFIHKYRTTNISNLTYPEYLKLHDWTQERNKEIEELVDIEETSIQLEMLIYLKFWEADMIIKKLYQFARALNGEFYDWYFKVSESNRDRTSTGTRQDIIRKKIRDRVEPHSETLYRIIKDTYKTQIRNSIAHSNYSFLGRHIHPNNSIKDDPNASIKALSFDDWIDMFHNTLSLHNEYLRMDTLINERYVEIASKNDNLMEILVTEKDGKQYPLYLEYRPEWNDWNYKQNH
ncbi:hypothetical protein [Algoriphagus terrigena]|uniref:hypothetical protein n=1 Tax=Algoriphagus terrigena TaxID=344884 RepID=UPI0004118D40|nr:hypothetical protein [Algoriphagus terrigena]